MRFSINTNAIRGCYGSTDNPLCNREDRDFVCINDAGKSLLCQAPLLPGTATGKLVGAVTHVLVNDPTTGYGIFIENMLDAAA